LRIRNPNAGSNVGGASGIVDGVKALVIEDERKLASFVARVLSEEGFAVDTCSTGPQGLRQGMSGVYDVIVVDWMLPELDGLSVVRELRNAGVTAPVLMLTARGETREKVLGFGAGADDYLVKPFEVEELVARIQSLVRRTAGFGRIKVKDLEIDRLAHKATLAGHSLDLTSKEFSLLVYLANRLSRIATKSELLAHVWSTSFDPGSNLVEVTVSRLRDKLGESAWMVETVRGKGYRLVDEKKA
jgi:DNA-binding response OmpR family regulator